MSNIYFLFSGVIIGFLCFIFIQPPPQGFDVSFSSSSSFPSFSSLNTTKDSFISLQRYLEKKYQPILGGETIFISQLGEIYTGTADGFLLHLNHKDGISKIAYFPGGILGGAVTNDGKGSFLFLLFLVFYILLFCICRCLSVCNCYWSCIL